jgi:hypothetical protein
VSNDYHDAELLNLLDLNCFGTRTHATFRRLLAERDAARAEAEARWNEKEALAFDRDQLLEERDEARAIALLFEPYVDTAGCLGADEDVLAALETVKGFKP